MDGGEFILRVRGASETRLFRFHGQEAVELHRLRESGHFERPGGTERLNQLIHERSPDEVTPGVSLNGSEAHFDMVADDELRGYLSKRLLERKGAAEGGGGSQGGPASGAPDANTPSPA
jgi:hypothetical protein